ncbi:MAG TPA: type II toxin-antitoxin system RelE/ParE family toxin [Longimicrobiaceae bacterium]|nr:type II toxin-antitoxin system RelE/ParE family toxin [Longimicrobiaceae bacterium]
MDRRVIWSEPALNDLKAAAEFIARDSPRYASVFVGRVRDAARSLAWMHERGRRVPEVEDPNVRELFVSRYRLIYEVAGGAVYILAFVHGARDLEALWRQ